MTSTTIVVATMDMTVKLGITLPKSIIQKIDQRRGDIPRSRYIRRAIERYLGGNNGSKDVDKTDNYNKAIAAFKKSRRK
jgi:metal-responsive CopG/Arc/MetJ family transcriptional regulator